MKLTDSDIITAARNLRDEQNERLHVAPNPLKRNSKPTSLWWAATAAALIIGYVAGGGLTPNPSPMGEGSGYLQELAEAQSSEITTPSLTGREGEPEPAIIREVIHEVVHDTIYQTRIVRVPVQQVMTAKAEPAPDPLPESPGCSMLCDDIRYDLLTGN
ncbi:MAG: hypothetical protein J6W75_04850 [Bacteroidaceae bacterium]|nr:hypothetical protein [Bacteroidaceae bacterium]